MYEHPTATKKRNTHLVFKGYIQMDNKLSGSYYTPFETIKFIFNYLKKQRKSFCSMLEPSVGDGRFIDVLLGTPETCKPNRIVGVELYAEKTKRIEQKAYPCHVQIVTSDFLRYTQQCDEHFELVVGNPPYINIKNMEKEFLENGRKLCKELNLPESLIQNSWVAFLLAATKLITNSGAILLVLPSEFLQVKYAENLRTFLEKKFNTIHIISFSERMFPEIEQEACLVYLTNEVQKLPYILYRQYEKLMSETFTMESRIERNKPLKKWSNAILSDSDIDLLNQAASRYTLMGSLADSAPGIVTGANNKFILTESEVIKYECKGYVAPIISKGVMAKNQFEINKSLIKQLAHENKKVYLLNLSGVIYTELPEALVSYLNEVATSKRKGIEVQYSYKCSKRKSWYAVPIVKSGSVVFFKRYDACPRLSTNPEEIYTTDIAYNLQLHNEIDAESIVFCFYNSLTLAQCEFVGRYYAGGVSELTPNEFRALSIPYRRIKVNDINVVKQMFSDNEPLEKIISFVNSKTLELDLDAASIERLNSIRTKLINRRK